MKIQNMKNTIKILTGKIHSGKTTSLFHFMNENDSVDGILAPIVNDKRKLYHISTKTMKDLEVDTSNELTISIGKYHFINETFIWANEQLESSYKQHPEWLIIDELGKLELKGEGLHKSTKEILEDKSNYNTKIILVIRDYLIGDVLDHYNIANSEFEILEL